MNLAENRCFEYPFGKKWVYASAIFSCLSMAFSLAILADNPFAILLYLAFVFVLTMTVLPLKFYFYLKKEEELEEHTIKSEETSRSNWTLIIFLFLTIIALCFPFIMAFILDPLWWIIMVGGFVPGISIPEIILYLYSIRVRAEDVDS